MICYLDMDGVLVDLYSQVPAGIRHNWDLTAEFFSQVDENWWANLPPTEDHMRIMDVVKDHFGAGRICLLTGLPPLKPAYERKNDPRIAAGKIRWIEKHYPQYNRQHYIGGHKHLAASPRHILIDDDDHNVATFRKSGGKAILLPRSWNTNARFPAVEYLKSVLDAMVLRRVA